MIYVNRIPETQAKFDAEASIDPQELGTVSKLVCMPVGVLVHWLLEL